MEEKTLLLAVLDDDQANLQTSKDLLKKYAIYELYERVVPSLFNSLLPALQRNTTSCPSMKGNLSFVLKI